MKFNKNLLFVFFVTVLLMIIAVEYFDSSSIALYLVVLIITIAMTLVNLAALLIDARLRYKGVYDSSNEIE